MVLGEAADGVMFDMLTGFEKLRRATGHYTDLLNAGAAAKEADTADSDWIYLLRITFDCLSVSTNTTTLPGISGWISRSTLRVYQFVFESPEPYPSDKLP